MMIYTQKLAEATALYQRLTRRYNTLSYLRLGVFLSLAVLIYFLIKAFSLVGALCVFIGVIAFLYLLSKHKEVAFARSLAQAKIKLNEQEIAFLQQGKYFADNGAAFAPENHPYSYDLDVFGAHSLYHYINRTHTYLGRKLLSERFLNPDETAITATQQQIQALTPDLDFRQNFLALTSKINDSEDFYARLNLWAEKESQPPSKFTSAYIKVAPVIAVISLIIGYSIGNELLKQVGKWLLGINLLVFLSFIGSILKEKLSFERAYDTLHSFKRSIEMIEHRYDKKELGISAKIAQLARLLDDLDNMSNILVSVPLNTLTFYHLHRYQQLLQWKKAYAKDIAQWLSEVASTEVLCSFANFAYNNPDFAYPTLNNAREISFTAMGHPLIPEKERITNDIHFGKDTFIILTGSNMSGKSTFLRALGVNMLLTLMGLPVCAREASVHPMKILVSMRMSDSLTDGKSYFFAEIDRLQGIIRTLEQEACFVLLDELLRGTNSEDKQLGTMKIIERMVALGAVGVIATHDLEVCSLAQHYPQKLQNKCFEVQINGDELYFDYRLREGICQQKNASFLMKKLGIIS